MLRETSRCDHIIEALLYITCMHPHIPTHFDVKIASRARIRLFKCLRYQWNKRYADNQERCTAYPSVPHMREAESSEDDIDCAVLRP